MIYDGEARSFDVDVDVDLKSSSEIVRKDSRISYTRESLLSLSEGEFCKELPAEVDKSSLFRDFMLSYARKDLLSLADLNVCKELPYRFDQSIISDLQDPSKSAPEIQKLRGHESLSFSRTSQASTEESVERWESFKLINANSNSKDSEKFNRHQLRRPSLNPTTTGILQTATQNPEKSGILGSWSDTTPSQDGSEISSPKLPASGSLLSRCSQPYRPPPYYKALSRPETPKHELNSNKTFGHTESTSKERATEESWRKDSIDLKTNEQQTIKKKQNSSEREEEVIAESGPHTPLHEHSALQIVNRFRVTPPQPILASVSASIEPPCSTCETESSLTEDSLKNKPLLQGQNEVPNHVEESQSQILEGSRFSALIILEDAEDVDPNLIDEADFASNVKLKGDQRGIVDNVGFAKTQKKGSRTQVALPLTKSTEKITPSIFPNNAVRKPAIMPAATKASTKPLSKISSYEVDLNKDNGFAKKTSDANHLATEAKSSDGSMSENWLSSHQTKHEDILMDRRDSCKLDSKSVVSTCSSDSDKAPSNFSSWSDLSHDNIWRTATEMLENPLDIRQSREDPEISQSFEELTSSQLSEPSNFIPSSLFEDETDPNFELNLPDEDSLITVDDTYIFQEEIRNQSPEIPLTGGRTASPFSASNNPIQTDNLYHQNLILPDLWLRDYSQLNIAKLFVNPLNTQADYRAPPQLQDPRRYQHYNYAPFQADTVPTGHPPLMPQIYGHSLPSAHSFYSHLDNTLPAEPPSYHQVQQMPWRQNEPHMLRSRPLDYQGNINSAYMGMRGCCHGEVEPRPTFSQIIQIGKCSKNR